MKQRMILCVGSLIVFLIAMCYADDARAQYNASVGLRLGGTSGITAKYFYKETMAAEGIVGWFGNGMSFTGLLEKYTPVYNATGLYLYYGGGAHIAFYNGRPGYYGHFGREVDYYRNNDVGFGINGIVGLEYRLPENIPIAISIDLKPFVELGTAGHVAFAPDPSFGIKFIIR